MEKKKFFIVPCCPPFILSEPEAKKPVKKVIEEMRAEVAREKKKKVGEHESKMQTRSKSRAVNTRAQD